jgi:hypothetical protein
MTDETDPMAHTTIPTAALTELLAAATECADDLASMIGPEYIERDVYPHMMQQYQDAIAPVRRLRAAVARVRGE